MSDQKLYQINSDKSTLREDCIDLMNGKLDAAILFVLKDGLWRCSTSELDNITMIVGILERIKHELLTRN
jgi:hypothetical protein